MANPIYNAIFEEISRSKARSSLFWWMVDHHDEILASVAGGRVSWERLCSEWEAAGHCDGWGRPASVRRAQETWRQARLVVKRRREARPSPDR